MGHFFEEIFLICIGTSQTAPQQKHRALRQWTLFMKYAKYLRTDPVGWQKPQRCTIASVSSNHQLCTKQRDVLALVRRRYVQFTYFMKRAHCWGGFRGLYANTCRQLAAFSSFFIIAFIVIKLTFLNQTLSFCVADKQSVSTSVLKQQVGSTIELTCHKTAIWYTKWFASSHKTAAVATIDFNCVVHKTAVQCTSTVRNLLKTFQVRKQPSGVTNTL